MNRLNENCCARRAGATAATRPPEAIKTRPRTGLGVRLRSVGLEEGEHGEDAPVFGAGLGQVQLGEDEADVFSTVPLVTQLVGDADVGAAFGH
jgi:hypothetical protein